MVGNILVRTSSHRCGTNRQSVCPDVSENLLTRLLRKRLLTKRNPPNLKNSRLPRRKSSKLQLILLTFLILNLIVMETW